MKVPWESMLVHLCLLVSMFGFIFFAPEVVSMLGKLTTRLWRSLRWNREQRELKRDTIAETEEEIARCEELLTHPYGSKEVSGVIRGE